MQVSVAPCVLLAGITRAALVMTKNEVMDRQRSEAGSFPLLVERVEQVESELALAVFSPLGGRCWLLACLLMVVWSRGVNRFKNVRTIYMCVCVCV